jgi:anthranilate synthase component 1
VEQTVLWHSDACAEAKSDLLVPGDAIKIPQPLQIEASFDLLDLHRLNPRRYPHLLQTVSRPQDTQAYDILFAFPGATLCLDASGVGFTPVSPLAPDIASSAGFLDTFDRWWEAEQQAQPHTGSAHDLPFAGGWFLYLGYELCAEIEPTLKTRIAPPPDIPTALATRFQTAIIYAHSEQTFYCVTEPDCHDRLTEIQRDIAATLAVSEAAGFSAPGNPGRLLEEPAQHYLDGVERIKRYIREGDIFQANLSRSWRLDTGNSANAADLYASLRSNNPAPFAGLASFNNFALLSSSPERLLSIRSGAAQTRPIAGTRPRGSSPAEDNAYSRELIAHPKERAEHIMLIDLERNDLGRICKPGSIHVSELMALESYAHVHHIVSNIKGELQEHITPGKAIGAVFPGGTITGCPKVRCMEILAELETGARGPYTGSIGYVNHNGDMDLNILIRTIMVEKTGISLRAGAGIVADSNPAWELEETRAKAKGMLKALGVENERIEGRGSNG